METTQQDGTAAPLEQALTGTPPGQQQAPVITAAPAEQAAPSVEQLQQQLATERQQREHYQKGYENLQPAYTRSQQALAALAQQPPPQQAQDPIAPYAQALVAKGYDAKQARDIAETNYSMAQQMMAPLQQRIEQQNAAMTGISQVDSVMAQVYQSNPALFSNPAIYEQTRQGMLATVMQGGSIDAQYAEYAAVIAAHEAAKRPPNGAAPAPQPQYTPPPQPFANGTFRGVQPTFQPQQQTKPAALPADAQFVADEMRARFNLPKQS